MKKRLGAMNTGNPFPMEFLFAIGTPQSKAIEAAFHRFFAEKRIRGEWFRLSEEDLSVANAAIDAHLSFVRATV